MEAWNIQEENFTQQSMIGRSLLEEQLSLIIKSLLLPFEKSYQILLVTLNGLESDFLVIENWADSSTLNELPASFSTRSGPAEPSYISTRAWSKKKKIRFRAGLRPGLFWKNLARAQT